MSENRRFCENCGQAIGEATNFCPSCGAAQRPDPQVPSGPPPQNPQPGSITTPNVGVPSPPPGWQETGSGATTRSPAGNALRGCLGVVVILVLVIFLAALCSGGGDESGDQSASDSPAEEAERERGAEEQREAAPEPEPEPPPAAIGETVEVGTVAWQITSAAPATQLTSDFMDPRQGNFVVVDFLFTNNGDEATTLDPISLSLLDGEGRTFEPDTDTFGYIPPDKDVFLNQVNPGVTDDGQVIFTVAPGAADFTLKVGDAAFFSDESARIDLGF